MSLNHFFDLTVNGLKFSVFSLSLSLFFSLSLNFSFKKMKRNRKRRHHRFMITSLQHKVAKIEEKSITHFFLLRFWGQRKQQRGRHKMIKTLGRVEYTANQCIQYILKLISLYFNMRLIHPFSIYFKSLSTI